MILMGLILILWTTSASAETTDADYCFSVVGDSTGRLDVAAVEAAAAPLIEFGAEVHVIAIPDGNNLREVMIGMAEKCSAWHSSPGIANQRLVMVGVNTGGRQTEIVFGSEYMEELHDYSKIGSIYMNPKFKQERYSDGVVAGLGAIYDRISVPISPEEFDGGGQGPWPAIFLVTGIVMMSLYVKSRSTGAGGSYSGNGYYSDGYESSSSGSSSSSGGGYGGGGSDW